MSHRAYPPLPNTNLLDLARTLDIRLAEFIANMEIIEKGNGTPEGVVEAPIGAIYQRLDGGASTTLYVKESGTGKTGWVAK